MVSTAIAMTCLGALGVVAGSLGLWGRLARLPSDVPLNNYSAQLLLGGALLGMGLVVLLEGSPIAGVLALPTAGLLVLGLYASLIKPPRWTQPQWQRDMDDDERRSRR